MITEKDLYGRQIPVDASTAQHLPGTAICLPGIEAQGARIQCLRCGSLLRPEWAQLPDQQYYCYQCINLGRVSTLTSLYHIPEPNDFPNRSRCTWQGKLTPQQATCAAEIKARFGAASRHLLWAVTGAGKTEMLFPGIAWALAQGRRVAVASPRVDVCLELAPRLQAAFADEPLALLHGREPEPYVYRQLTVCTTHQLLRFRHAFDVLIIDEVDAFPFAANPRLAYAVNNAVKPSGALLYLTATPSQDLLRQVARQQLSISYLPLRYHQHLLPTITVQLTPSWRQQLQAGQLPRCLQKQLQRYVQTGQRFLLFVPHVAQLSVVWAALKACAPALKGLTVHAADPDRLAKVQQMRAEQVQYLITTTILERGVTFPGIDVIVLGADDAVFSTAALVQIAGRVGRSANRPTGLVWMLAGSHSRPLKAAQRQIKLVNQKGRRLRRAMPTMPATASN